MADTEPTEPADPRLEEAKPGEVALIDRAGNRFAVPEEHLSAALADTVSGFHVETPEEAKQRQDEAKYGDRELAAGAAGAARGLTIGLSDYGLTKTGLVKPETLSGLKEQNPVSTMVGEGVGTVAGLVVPGLAGASGVGLTAKAGEFAGGLAEHALGEGVAAKLATSAARGAVEGTFYGLGNTISEASLGDEQVTAQKLIAGAGMGALLAGSVSVASTGLGLGLKYGTKSFFEKGGAKAAESSGDVASEAAAESPVAGEAVPGVPKPSGTTFAELADQHKGAIDEAKGILRKNYEGAKEQIKSTFADPREWLAGQAEDRTLKATGFIQSDLTKLSDEQQKRIARRLLDNGDITPGAKAEDILARVQARKAEAGKAIGEALKTADQTGAQFDLGAVVDRARKDILAPMTSDPAKKTEAKAVEALLDDYEARAEQGVTFREANEFKGTLQKQVKDFLNTADSKQARKELSGILNDEIETQLGDSLSGKAKDAFVAAKEAYADYSVAAKAGLKATKRELGNRYFSMTDSLAGIGGAVAGGPAGIVTGALGAIGNKLARERGSSLMATTLDAFAKSPAFGEMSTAFQAFYDKAAATVGADGESILGKYAEALHHAAKHSSEDLLMAHAVLSEKDPAYREVMQKAGLDYHEPPMTAPRRAATMAALKLRMDEQDLQISKAVDAFLKQKVIRGAIGAGSDAAGPLDAKGRDRRERFNQQASLLEQLSTNPDSLIERIGSVLGPLQEDAPTIATGLSSTAAAGVNFLYSKMPKANDPNESIPALASGWRPSDSQLSQFDRYVAAVTDPNSVFDGLRRGSITREAVESLQAVYPQFYDELKAKVMQQVAGHPNQLTFKQKMVLGSLLGSPLVKSAQPDRLAMLQQSFAAPQPKQGGGGGGERQSKTADGHQSASDRIESR